MRILAIEASREDMETAVTLEGKKMLSKWFPNRLREKKSGRKNG